MANIPHVHTVDCFEGRTMVCTFAELDPETGMTIVTPELTVARAEAEERADREADARRDGRCVIDYSHERHEGTCEEWARETAAAEARRVVHGEVKRLMAGGLVEPPEIGESR